MEIMNRCISSSSPEATILRVLSIICSPDIFTHTDNLGSVVNTIKGVNRDVVIEQVLYNYGDKVNDLRSFIVPSNYYKLFYSIKSNKHKTCDGFWDLYIDLSRFFNHLLNDIWEKYNNIDDAYCARSKKECSVKSIIHKYESVDIACDYYDRFLGSDAVFGLDTVINYFDEGRDSLMLNKYFLVNGEPVGKCICGSPTVYCTSRKIEKLPTKCPFIYVTPLCNAIMDIAEMNPYSEDIMEALFWNAEDKEWMRPLREEAERRDETELLEKTIEEMWKSNDWRTNGYRPTK